MDPEDLRFPLWVVGFVDVWRDFRPGILASPGGTGFIFGPQPISDRPMGLGFPHRAGRCRPGEARFRPLVVPEGSVCRGFGSEDGNLSSSGSAGFIFEAQPISDHQVGLGFPHCEGRCRPEGSFFSSPGGWSCGDTGGFPNQRRGPTIPGCGETEGFPRGTTLAACPATPHWQYLSVVFTI